MVLFFFPSREGSSSLEVFKAPIPAISLARPLATGRGDVGGALLISCLTSPKGRDHGFGFCVDFHFFMVSAISPSPSSRGRMYGKGGLTIAYSVASKKAIGGLQAIHGFLIGDEQVVSETEFHAPT